MNLRKALQGGPAALALAALCGCGQATAPQTGPETAPGTDLGAATSAAPQPGAVVTEQQDVEFYPACGNEELVLDGTRWYPLPQEDRERLDHEHEVGVGVGVEPTAAGAPHTSLVVVPASSRPLPAVVAPGPGDDVGTVTVYGDGLARFESDSGDLVAWLTTEPRTYNWVC